MRVWLVMCVVSIVSVVPSGTSAQGRMVVSPSISIGTTHDDNLFAESQGTGDYLTTVTPLFDVSYDVPRLTFTGWTAVDMRRSMHHPSLNDLDARRNAAMELGTIATQKLRLSLAGRYYHTDSPGDLNLETGVLLGRQVVDRVQATPAFAYQVSSRTALSGRYDWTRESLSFQPARHMREARINMTRHVSPLTTWSVGYLGQVFDDPPSRYGSDAVLVGWNWMVAPETRFSIQAGPRRTSYRGVQPEITASLARMLARGRLEFEYWHGDTLVTGVPGPVAVRSGTAKLVRIINRRWEIGTHLGAFESRALYDAQVRVMRGLFVAAWSPTESVRVAASYGAAFQQGRIRLDRPDDGDTLRRAFSLNLTVWPLGRHSRALDDGGSALDGVLQGVSR